MSPNPVPVSGAGFFLEHPAQGVEESAVEEKMSNWSHGYNVEGGYTFGFYREMSPGWLDYVAMLTGVQAPQGNARRYLELGCGQGFHLLTLAASNPDIEFVGIDFDPLHITHGQDLAVKSGLTNIRFLEADFAALAQGWPADLGTYDYVALHGIYTWISIPLRAAVTKCLGHAVKPVGLVYNGYNTQPGWLAGMALQHFLRKHRADTGLPPPQAIESGIGMMKRLAAADAALFKQQPGLVKLLETVEAVDRSYAVHEYLHEGSWHPLWHSEVAAELTAAKLSYIGSATLPECYLPGLLSRESQAVIAEARNPALQQDLIAACINQSFRRDVFQRGAVKHWPVDAQKQRNTQAFVLVAGAEEYQMNTSFGNVTGNKMAYDAIVALLRQGNHTLADIAALDVFRDRDISSVLQSITFFIHGGYAYPARPEADKTSAIRFNLAVANAVAAGAPYEHIACASIGSGIKADKVDFLMLAALDECDNQRVPELLASGFLARLNQLGIQLIKQQVVLTDPEAQRNEAIRQATLFIEKTLPAWERLGAWS